MVNKKTYKQPTTKAIRIDSGEILNGSATPKSMHLHDEEVTQQDPEGTVPPSIWGYQW